MSAVGELADRKDRPAYVRFETVTVENKAASLAAGHYVGLDVDYALITPPYSKDVFKIKVPQWKANMQQDVQNGRLPPQWMDDYLEAYRRWKAGQDIPVNGTPIKGWGVIAPAQQETLLRMNILTVEDLAAINDEGLKRIGMGSMDLKNKANGWLAQLKDKGPLTQEIAAVRAENELLKKNLSDLSDQMTILSMQVKATAAQEYTPSTIAETQASVSIPVSDIIEDAPPAPPPRKAKVAVPPAPKVEQL